MSNCQMLSQWVNAVHYLWAGMETHFWQLIIDRGHLFLAWKHKIPAEFLSVSDKRMPTDILAVIFLYWGHFLGKPGFENLPSVSWIMNSPNSQNITRGCYRKSSHMPLASDIPLGMGFHQSQLHPSPLVYIVI